MEVRAGGLRIVVVGGGISGCFAAYFLARAGAAVTVIEREGVAAGASGSNPGGLNPLYGPGIPGPLQALALDAFRLHQEHWDEVGRAASSFLGWRTKARLNVARDAEDERRLAAMHDTYAATAGFSARWLDRDELEAIEPRLAPSIERGLLAEGDARVVPRDYTAALAAAATGRGARFTTGEVVGIERSGTRATAVVSDARTVPCDGVVVATGAWCDGPARWLDVPLPMVPVKGDMVLAELTGGGVSVDLAWRDAAVYLTDSPTVWLGGTEESAGFDRRASAAARASILERVASILPAVVDARVVQQTSALRPLAPDGLPIVGVVDGWTNACVALGGGRKGMLLGSAMGKAAADLLTTGRTDLPIDGCRPSRFARSEH